MRDKVSRRRLLVGLLGIIGISLVGTALWFSVLNSNQPIIVPKVIDTLSVPNMEMIIIPDPESLTHVKINQGVKITVELISKDNHTVLAQLPGSYGQSNASLQHLLGDHNVACIAADLDADPNQFDIEPTHIQEYPLNQTNITWSWIITPKTNDANIFDISFSASGKSACAADKDPLVGPYRLAQDVTYFYTVINPDSTPTPTAQLTSTTTSSERSSNSPVISSPPTNIFGQIYNQLGIGTIITGTVATLLAAFVVWLCSLAWKRRKKKTKGSYIPKQPRKNTSRRSRRKRQTVKSVSNHS